MTQPLEDRYRRLLRSYPKAYREERSDEIVATLMELARPGQRTPTIREAAALVLGGLRTRTGGSRQRTTAMVWAGALHLAVLLLLASAAANLLARSIGAAIQLNGTGDMAQLSQVGLPLAGAFVGAAMVAAAAGRRVWVLAVILLAIIFEQWANRLYVSFVDTWGFGDGFMWQLLLTGALTIPLLRWRTPTSSRPARWLLAIPVALIIMPTQLLVFVPWRPWIVAVSQLGILLAVLLGCLLWSFVDARVPIAAGAVLMTFALQAILTSTTDAGTWAPWRNVLTMQALVAAVVAAVPITTGALRAARQSRL
jgi:hypothetical protein